MWMRFRLWMESYCCNTAKVCATISIKMPGEISPRLKKTGRVSSRKKANNLQFALAICNPQQTKMKPMTKFERIASWICRIVAAVILLQTLFFKFTGAEESVYIFTKVGMEPWGRYGSGVVELIASILLLIPRRAWLGALLALGTMTGALISHLTVLGIVVKDDGGLLFGM